MMIAKHPEVWSVMLTFYKDDGSIDPYGNERLVEWYCANRVNGIFSVCLSSEMYTLSQDERLRLASLTVRNAAKEVQVVACGGFGNSLQKRLDDIQAMAQTGVGAVVLPLSALYDRDLDDDKTVDSLLELFSRLPDVKFGLYECPVPYRRGITPEMLRKLLSGTRQLVFMKDTCCDLKQLLAKAAITSGTSMKLLNANITTLLPSIQGGCDGYCGIAANVLPDALGELFSCVHSAPLKALQIQNMLNMLEFCLECNYPRGAKAMLDMAGLPVTEYSRTNTRPCTSDELARLRAFRAFLKFWQKKTYIL